jgi:hypothetical protein
VVKKWQGSKPDKCGLCNTEITTGFIDGCMRRIGVWAIMCPGCWAKQGLELGTGSGQAYERIGTDWVKVAG